MIGSTETKYIKLNTKTQNTFCCVNENLTTFLTTFVLSIGSTENKYVKLNTKTQNTFCCLNENLMTFLYTLTGGTRKQKEKKRFSLSKSIQKSNVIKKKLGFSIQFYVFGFSLCKGQINRRQKQPKTKSPKWDEKLMKHHSFQVPPIFKHNNSSAPKYRDTAVCTNWLK